MQLAGKCLIMTSQALSGVTAAQQDPIVRSDILAQHLFVCLQHMHWLGSQLQQLVLPGKTDKAAAALQDLQKQQQLLQQTLSAAVWRLNRAAVIMADVTLWQAPFVKGFTLQPDIRFQHNVVAASSEGFQLPVSFGPPPPQMTYWYHWAAQQQWQQQPSGGIVSHLARAIGLIGPTPIEQLAALASTQPDEGLTLADLDPLQHNRQQQQQQQLLRRQAYGTYLNPKVAVELTPQLPQQLKSFGAALWSALPRPR
jgi:hypothetical protein